jgi:1-acyl-sn-glycerol-3-phosphate acyltransferase
MNQDINCFCAECGERFSSTHKEICVFNMCNHLIHLKCNTSLCKICDKWRGMALHANPTNNVDIKSIKKNPIKWTWTDRLRGLTRLFISIPVIASLFIRLTFNLIDLDYIFWLNKYLCWLLNIHIKCSNKSYYKLIDSSYKRVIIANHTNYHDALVIGFLLNPNITVGVVASPITQKVIFGRIALAVLPHIITEQSSTFNKISDFFKINPEESRLLIFPEGMLTHEKTICKFRSSAFKLGYPVQPLVIDYKQNVFNLKGFDFLCQNKINVQVTVCDPVNTDETIESIESVREQMAKIGDFNLSSVSNKKLNIYYFEL